MDTTKRSVSNRVTRFSAFSLSSPWLLKISAWMAIGVIFLVSIYSTMASIGYVTYQISGQIMPGVTVAGMPLEGMSLDSATLELDRVWNQEMRVTVVDGSNADRAWIVAPGEFGLAVDAQATAMRAFAVGRGQGLFQGVRGWLRGFREPVEVVPWVYLDREKAREGLEAWASLVGVPAVEAQLSIDAGDVHFQQGRYGWVLDVEASLDILQQNPMALLTQDFLIPLVTVPSDPNIMDVSQTAAEIETLLQMDVGLSAYDPVTDEHFTWKPSRETVASWLELTPGISRYAVDIRPGDIDAYLKTLDASLGGERTFDHEAARQILERGLDGQSSEAILIQYLPTSYVVVSGDNLVSIGFKVSMPFWKLLEENPLLSRRGLRVGETLVVPPKDSMLELPIVMDKRIVISISEQRMWVYQDGNVYREYVVSTGISSSPTLPGVFQILTHELNAYASIWDLYMPHFLGIYYATPDLLNGIHGLPLLSSGRRLWADVLGRPASFGCIILDLDAAEELYAWAENGVIVEIRR